MSYLLLQIFAAELRARISSIQDGLAAYEKVMKLNSEALAHLKLKIEQLQIAIVDDSQAAIAKMVADTKEVERIMNEMQQNYGKTLTLMPSTCPAKRTFPAMDSQPDFCLVCFHP